MGLYSILFKNLKKLEDKVDKTIQLENDVKVEFYSTYRPQTTDKKKNSSDRFVYYGHELDFNQHNELIQADTILGEVFLVVYPKNQTRIQRKNYNNNVTVINVNEDDSQEEIAKRLATAIQLKPLIQRAQQELERLQSSSFYWNKKGKVQALFDAINAQNPNETDLLNALQMNRNITWDKRYKSAHSKPTSYLNAVQLPQLEEEYHKPIKKALGNTLFGGGKKLQVEKTLSAITYNTSAEDLSQTKIKLNEILSAPRKAR